MHTDAVLPVDRVNPFDLSTPVKVFSRIRLPDTHAGYRVRPCAERPRIDAGLFTRGGWKGWMRRTPW
ncbi:hypothetical protein [Nocardia sp. NPDC059239]|uniref:hypothetical protein n=1 Tax=unclassified Nocardia TaxID=2637762 RepID=UPI0036B5F304